ncbi:hypothetical protein J6590_078418 [Homalodisca vitripennis]|nr:hypothetical protein J6590_078418 [Homalodisca vitripennis]
MGKEGKERVQTYQKSCLEYSPGFKSLAQITIEGRWANDQWSNRAVPHITLAHATKIAMEGYARRVADRMSIKQTVVTIATSAGTAGNQQRYDNTALTSSDCFGASCSSYSVEQHISVGN